tara:strand:+ start:129592 stop:136290 length:6699 start_codon:yes stop_codon:yes gene_type:complete
MIKTFNQKIYIGKLSTITDNKDGNKMANQDNKAMLTFINADTHNKITALAEKSSPSTSDVDQAIKLFESVLTNAYTVAINNYNYAEKLQDVIKENHDALVDMTIKAKGDITVDDLEAYTDQATVLAALDEEKPNQKDMQNATAAQMLFIGDLTRYNDSTGGSPKSFTARRAEAEEKCYTTENTKKREEAKLINKDGAFYRYYLYQAKIADKPGTFSRSGTRQEFIAHIDELATRCIPIASQYAKTYMQKSADITQSFVTKYQGIGAVSTLLETTFKNTLAAEQKDSFKLNHRAYYEALISPAVQDFVKSGDIKSTKVLFTDKMANSRPFIVNALNLALTDAKQIDLSKESYIVGGLLADTLGNDYAVELLNTAIAYNEAASKKINLPEFQASVKRYQDYIQIIKTDPRFADHDERNEPTKALINYNTVLSTFDDLSSYTVEGITEFINSDKMGALITPIKEEIFANRYGNDMNFLAFFMEHIKKSTTHKKMPAAINEAAAIDQLSAATSPAFAQKLVLEISKKSNDPALKARMKDIAPILDNYSEGAAANYAKSTHALKEAVSRSRPDVILKLTGQDYVQGIYSEDRIKLMLRNTEYQNDSSTPINALYNYAQKDSVALAEVLTGLANMSTSSDELQSYVKALNSLAEGTNQTLQTQIKVYAGVLAEHDGDTLINLAKTQLTVASKFNPEDTASLNSFLASPELENLPVDVQTMAVNEDVTSQMLIGMLRESGDSAVKQAQSFDKITTLIKNEATTQRAFEIVIEKAESKPETAQRFSDYVAVLSAENGREILSDFAQSREDFYAALNGKDAEKLATLILTSTTGASSDNETLDAQLKMLVLTDGNLQSSIDVMLSAAQDSTTQKTQYLALIAATPHAQSVFEHVLASAASDNEKNRLSTLISLIQGEDTSAPATYATLDENIAALLKNGDTSGLRELLASDAFVKSGLSESAVQSLIAQPLSNGKNIPEMVLTYKADDAEQLAQNLAAVSGHISNDDRLELLQKQDSSTGFDVFTTLMHGKDIYAQADTVITFSTLMDKDHGGRNTILQGYVNNLREQNAAQGVEEDTNEIKQFLTMVNIVATTFSDDELEADVKAKQIAKIQGLLGAIQTVSETQDASKLTEFLKSDTYQNNVDEYSVFSPANLLKQYPTPENNAINIMFAATDNDRQKELAFFAEIETIFAGDHITMEFYEDIIAKHAEDEAKCARIQGYVSAAVDGNLSTIVNIEALNVKINDAAQKPSMKKFKAIIDSAEFQALDEENRASIISAAPQGQEDGLSIAQQIIRLGAKSPEKMAENIQYIGAQFENTTTLADILYNGADHIENTTSKAQYIEYVSLLANNEVETLNSLAKVQTTIAKAVKDSDVSTLQSLIEDQSLKDLGAERREKILSQPLIGDKTLLSLLAENANGDMDEEIKVFINTAKSIDDPELFNSLASVTIENAENAAMRTRFSAYAEMINNNDEEEIYAKLGATKAINAALEKPNKLSIESLARDEAFTSISESEAHAMFKKPAIDEQSLFTAALSNAKTPNDHAAAIHSLAELFTDRDYTKDLISHYAHSIDDSATSARDIERLNILVRMAYNEDINPEMLTKLGTVFTEIDKANAKGSQIALRNILSSSAYQALPGDYQARFVDEEGQDNILSTLLNMAENDAVQETELLADMIAATQGDEGAAYKQITTLINHSDSDAQRTRLEDYRSSLYAKTLEIDGETIDPAQISMITPQDRWYYQITGKNAETWCRIDEDDKALKKLRLSDAMLAVGNGQYYAKDEIGYISYNTKKHELEVFHVTHTEENPVFSTREMHSTDALNVMDDLCRTSNFVALPIAGKISALNINRIQGVQYNTDKNILNLETITGSLALKKVEREAVRPLLRALVQSGAFFQDDENTTFIRKNTAHIISHNEKKDTLFVKGQHKTFTLKNVNLETGSDIAISAAQNSDFIEDDKQTVIAKNALAMIGFDENKDELLLAISRDEKFTKSCYGSSQAQDIITEYVKGGNFIWRDSISASNINRVKSVEIDPVLKSYTLSLVTDAKLTVDNVLDENLKFFTKALESNPNISKVSSTDYAVKAVSAIKPLIVPKPSLTTQFNAATIIEELVAKTSIDRVQAAIAASANWLDTMHSAEMDNDGESTKMQTLGALLLNAYTAHADIPENLTQRAANNTPKAKTKQAAEKKDALSALQASFNQAAAGGTSEKTQSVTAKAANDIANNNPVMQHYQEALDQLAIK